MSTMPNGRLRFATTPAYRAGWRPAGGRLHAVEHPVDDDARHRHVEPDGERPARERLVLREAAPQRPRERPDGEHRHGGGEDGVGAEDAEVETADPALVLEAHVTDGGVVDEVRGEKRRREHER